jgi:hypothetical protein
MACITRTGAKLVAVTIAAACGREEESRAAEGTGMAATASSVGATAEAAVPRISNVMIGKRVDPGNRITEPTFQFTPGDTVHVSVATEGGGNATVTAAWRSQSGTIVQRNAEQLRVGGEHTAFSLAQPKGLKPGTYKVIVFLNSDSVDTKVFVVK